MQSGEGQKGWSLYDATEGDSIEEISRTMVPLQPSTNLSSIRSDVGANDPSSKRIAIARCSSAESNFNETRRERDAIEIQQDAGLCFHKL
jgi:hypothetical protein